jgi:hypothetical protein
MEALEAAGPYGAASPAPRVALARVRIAHPRPVGEGHVAVDLAEAGGGRIAAIAFRAAGTPLGAALMEGATAAPRRGTARARRLERAAAGQADDRGRSPPGVKKPRRAA